MVGLTLIIFGFMLLVLVIFAGLLRYSYLLIKNIFELIGVCFYIIYDYIFVIRKDKKTGYYQKQLLRKQLEKESKEKNLEKARRDIVIGAMNFVTKMRASYPYADEGLFQEAMRELPKETCRKTMEDYEDLIKDSHNENLENRSFSSLSNTYSLVDLEDLDPIEVRSEKPITMTLYQIEDDYVIWVFNSQTNENTLLQSKDYLLIANYMVTILELQQNLRKLKESVRSIQLENIFNVKKESASNYNNINNVNRRW